MLWSTPPTSLVLCAVAQALWETFKEQTDGEKLDPAGAETLKKLWNNAQVQVAFERKSEFQLNDSAD